jgi:hypothetical protein
MPDMMVIEGFDALWKNCGIKFCTLILHSLIRTCSLGNIYHSENLHNAVSHRPYARLILVAYCINFVLDENNWSL